VKKVQNIKYEGSRNILLLLFTFIQLVAAGLEEPRDTIILDGEIIYIRKREVVANLDSLQNEALRDIRLPAQNKIKYLLTCPF